MKRNFKEWLSSFRPCISNYCYYANFDKIYANAGKLKVELNILNSLIGSKDIEKDFSDVISKYPETLKCIPILLAVRSDKIYALDSENVYEKNRAV